MKKAANWWLSFDGCNKEGPISEEELSDLFSTGKISKSTMVWRKDMQGWKIITEVPELLIKSDEQPPPLPQRITLAPENITQEKHPEQEQQISIAMTKGCSSPAESSPQQSTKLQHEKIKGVGGWLALLIFGLVFAVPFWTIVKLGAGYQEIKPYSDQYPGLLTIQHISAFIGICIAIFAIIAGMKLWKIKPNAIETAKKYFQTVAIFTIIESALPFMAGLPSDANYAILNKIIIPFIFANFISIAVWYTYLCKSKRVAATYSTHDDMETVWDSTTSNIIKPEKGDRSEKNFEQVAARELEEVQKVAPHNIPEVSKQDEEFIALLKFLIKENRLDNISDEYLLGNCKRAQLISAQSNNLDIELSKTINTFLEEIKKRGEIREQDN